MEIDLWTEANGPHGIGSFQDMVGEDDNDDDDGYDDEDVFFPLIEAINSVCWVSVLGKDRF